jgi:4-diphosphocytidyl-2-C-methyl-D-erythritol kinase
MRVYSPGKINLHLRVGPVRPDGFHPLCSWMVTVGLFDTLDFTLTQSGESTLSCDHPDVPCDSRNLILRAANTLRQAAAAEGKIVPGANIALEKLIPIGGGMGGGSGNAATTLTALNELWQLNWPIERLMPIAATLGSDVPFFLGRGSAWCFGRGEIVQPARALWPNFWAVLILPPIASATPAVYRQFDQTPASTDWDGPIDIARWEELSPDELLARCRNDLEPPCFALYPQLKRWQQSAENVLKRPVRLSGSGSTLFTLFDNILAASFAAEAVTRECGLPCKAAMVCPT